MPEFAPQPGPQRKFLESAADIVIYGGAAGGGKSWALLADDLYHIENPRYSSLTFRRVSPQITNPGGLWDEASQLYPLFGAKANQNRLEWRFPSGATAKFAHLQYEADKFSYQGAQINVIKFDELTHFTESMFFYMLSRNRSVSGIRPYIRASCNADADSWVASFIAWWIDQETGFPIPERAGVIRWFVRDGGQLHWASNAADLPWVEVEGVPQPPKSVAFIPAKVTDNKILLAHDPGYLTNLLSMPLVDRARLLEGNWKIKPAAGLYFKRHWFEIVDVAPAGVPRVRRWDFAATKQKPGTDPDWTAGALVSRTADGLWYIEDMRRERDTPGAIEALVKQTAVLDGKQTDVYLEQEPGSAGKAVVDHYIREMPGYTVYPDRVSGPKEERIKPVSSQAQAMNIKLVRGEWNAAFLDEAEQYPDGAHDDQLDTVAGAFEQLAEGDGLPYGWLRNDPAIGGPVTEDEAALSDEERIHRRLVNYYATAPRTD